MHFIGRSPSDKQVVTCLAAKLDDELLVTEGDRALLFESGAVLVDLGPGRHPLSPSQIPALRVAGDLSGVQIFFVRSVPVPHPIQGATPPIPVDGYNVVARVEFEGTWHLQVTDPRRLLSTLMGGPAVGGELVETASRSLKQALAQMLKQSGGPLIELCANPPAGFVDAVRARAAQSLEPHGATLTGLALKLHLDDEAQKQLAKTAPPGSAAMPVPVPAIAGAPTAPAPLCPRCGSLSTSGKFCSSCGAPMTSGCSACGAPVASGAKFCSSCGKPVTLGPPRCSGCGAELAAGAKFCSTCGTKTQAR